MSCNTVKPDYLTAIWNNIPTCIYQVLTSEETGVAREQTASSVKAYFSRYAICFQIRQNLLFVNPNQD